MRLLRIISGFIGASMALAGPARADHVLTIFAAASTAPAIGEIAEQYHAYTGGRFQAVFASSGVLARQIDNGAPADLYLSANGQWMDWLAKRGALDGASVALLTNRLVLVQPAGAPRLRLDKSLAAALAGERLAIGDPDHVPAGIYASQALRSMGLWEELAPLAVRMKDVQAVLLLVQREEAAAGIVYASDALGDPRLRVVAEFPADSHEPIRYMAAVLRDGEREDARKLLDFLRGPMAGEIFRRHGFATE